MIVRRGRCFNSLYLTKNGLSLMKHSKMGQQSSSMGSSFWLSSFLTVSVPDEANSKIVLSSSNCSQRARTLGLGLLSLHSREKCPDLPHFQQVLVFCVILVFSLGVEVVIFVLLVLGKGVWAVKLVEE